MIENIIIFSVLLIIAVGIICFLIRAKKKGGGCIGCPYAKQCEKKNNEKCSCSETDKNSNAK